MSVDLLSKEVLQQLPIFAGMTAAERDELLEIATTLEFAPGKVVLQQGKNSQNLMVLLQGECQVIKQTDDSPPCVTVLAELEPRDHFGDMSFFHAAPHSASVRTISEVKLLRFERKYYDVLIENGSLAAYKLAYNILNVLAKRLRRMDDWVSELLCGDTPTRQNSEWSNFREKLFNGWNL